MDYKKKYLELKNLKGESLDILPIQYGYMDCKKIIHSITPTRICDYAFSNNQLRFFDIPESVISIGVDIFQDNKMPSFKTNFFGTFGLTF